MTMLMPVIWAVFTVIGVLTSEYDDGVTATILFPILGFWCFCRIVFVLGPPLFNRSPRDDTDVTYGDLLISIAVWVLSVGNLLFVVWLWDRNGSFSAIENASVFSAWKRLNNNAILFSCGIGYGVAAAQSELAETVLAYLAAITISFIGIHLYGGFILVREARQQKDILHSK